MIGERAGLIAVVQKDQPPAVGGRQLERRLVLVVPDRKGMMNAAMVVTHRIDRRVAAAG